MDLSLISRFINPLDICAAAVILIFMFFAGRRGLVRSLFGLFSFFISIFLANMLYPLIGRLLKQSDGLIEWLKGGIVNAAWMPEASDYSNKAAQNLFISGLNLPDFMKFSLMENNNPEAYGALNVSGLADYIEGFFANVAINIVAMLIAFMVIYLGMKLIGKLLDAVAKLPVISALNRLGGLAIGFLQGVLVLWLIFTGFTLFLSKPYFAEFLNLLERSSLTATLYENNFILHLVMRVVP